MKAYWYVLSGGEYAGWTVAIESTEEHARRKAEAWAQQGKQAFVARCKSIYRPAATREDTK